MGYELINIGTPNGNNGDTIRDAFKKSNDNDVYLKQKVDDFANSTPGVINTNNLTTLTPLDARMSLSGDHTGAIKIIIPKENIQTMFKFFVEIFDYTIDESISLIISGYTFPFPQLWYNPSVQIICSKLDRNFTVRYGFEGTKYCLYIGELNSTWSFPKVAITKVVLGHYHIEQENWLTGWQILFETSTFQNIKHTRTNNLPVSQ